MFNSFLAISSLAIAPFSTASAVARAFSASNAGSQTRGIIGAGGNAPGLSDVIDYITIASAGNATDFGNLGAARSQFSGSSSPTRAVFFGGLE